MSNKSLLSCFTKVDLPELECVSPKRYKLEKVASFAEDMATSIAALPWISWVDSARFHRVTHGVSPPLKQRKFLTKFSRDSA